MPGSAPPRKVIPSVKTTFKVGDRIRTVTDCYPFKKGWVGRVREVYQDSSFPRCLVAWEEPACHALANTEVFVWEPDYECFKVIAE